MATKKDYELIAATIKRTREQDVWGDDAQNVLSIVTLRLAAAFADDNPRFKREVFYRECGYES